MDDVRLVRIGGRIGAGHGDVDRGIDHDGRMHHRSGKSAVAAVTGAVVAATEPAMGEPEGTRYGREGADVSARCGIAVATVAANARDLGRGLIEVDDVGLIGTRCGMIAGLGHVERLERSMAGVDHAPGKMAIAAIAGAVMSGVGRKTLPRISGR